MCIRRQTLTLVSIILAMALLVPALACTASPTEEAGVELIYSTHVNQPGTSNQIWEALFLPELVDKTKGYIKIKDSFYSEALVKATEQLESCGKGISDIAYICTGYSPAALPLTSLAEMLYITNAGDAVASAMTELYETYPPLKEEYHKNNVEVLAFQAPQPSIIGVNTVINSAADLKGLKVRAYGITAEVIKRGGGMVPVPLSSAEIYSSMQTGVVNGYAGIPMWMPCPEGWIEVTKSIAHPRAGCYYVCVFVMNLDKYNALPQDVKDIIVKMRKEFPKPCAELTMEHEKACVEECQKLGIKLYLFTDEEAALWEQNANPAQLAEELIKTREEITDAPVREFFDLYKQTVKKYESDAAYEQQFPK